MKALSVQQPYADLIVERAYKDDPHRVLKPIENRPRPLPKTFTVPQRIYVHASLTLYPVKLEEVRCLMLPSQWQRLGYRLSVIYNLWASHKSDTKFRQDIGYFGCIIGEVTITWQVTATGKPQEYVASSGQYETSPWFFGPWGYLLTDPVRYEKPIPYRGRLGLFEVPEFKEGKC